MSRTTQLLGCVALVSAVALAPAAMARGGGSAAAVGKPAAGVSAKVAPSPSGATARVAPMMKPLEPHLFPGPSVASPVTHADLARNPSYAYAPGPKRDPAPPHLYPRTVVATPMSHAKIVRNAPSRFDIQRAPVRAELAGRGPRQDPHQFPRTTYARLHQAHLAGNSHDRIKRLVYTPGSSTGATQ